MKRDMDLIRSLILDLERAPVDGPLEFTGTDGFSDREVVEHQRLLVEAGLVDGLVELNANGEPWVILQRLTWEGHEFAAALGNQTVWAKSRSTILTKVGSVPVEVLRQVLVAVAKGELGLGL